MRGGKLEVRYKKVAFITLGCKTNQYESNAMAQKFIDSDYKICKIEENPDIIVVNTCTVTNIADRKSRQALRNAKNNNPNAVVIACGCYVQVAKEKIKEIKEIDLCIGNSEKKDIVEVLEKYLKDYKDNNEIYDVNEEKEYSELGIIAFSEKTRATIKIQDGCNNFCTYCLIPYARGRVRSRKKENIIEEVSKVVELGIKEIVITGIHIASYGIDFETNYKLIDLLEDINKIDGLKRIRLGSLEPSLITEKFCQRLSNLKKICNHFHLSLQSGCDETLKRMNRKYTTNEFRKVTERLRKYFKDVNLTTDIIVGFPGETDEEFNKTYNFLQEIKFYKMHVFKYSERDGTVAAKMPNQVDAKIKEERSKKLIELSNKNQEEINKSYQGKQHEVLFEEQKNGIWTGYTTNYIKVSYKSDDDLENKIHKMTL